MRRSLGGVLLGAAVIAAGCALWLHTAPPTVATPIVATIVVPAAPVVIEHTAPPPPPPAPPPPEPAPPPPEPTLAAPVVGTRCAAHVETIGVPLTDAVLEATPRDSFDETRTFTMDSTGCAIAIALTDALIVTWDGGQSFARYAIAGRLDSVVLAGDRAVVLRDNQLGVVHADEPAITWRSLESLAIPADDADHHDAASYLRIAAAGTWTAVMRTHREVAVAPEAAPAPPASPPAARLLAISDDDGATWRYLTPPEAETLEITDDGRLWLHRDEWIGDDSGPGTTVVHTFASDLAHTRWFGDDKLPARRGAPAYHYEFERDRFWGCGGTEKLVAHRGGRAVTLASDLHAMDDPIGVVENAVAAYAIYGEGLYRLRGVHSTPVAGTSIRDLLGVDRAGTLIAHHGPLLLRWSERGGWRILWSAP
ncbi:MAG TPA: hypothetical protein VFP84_04060 [Kofleriaceae bacterium]|nr:hypothetical protein [Kofleriaceae bacterium]